MRFTPSNRRPSPRLLSVMLLALLVTFTFTTFARPVSATTAAGTGESCASTTSAATHELVAQAEAEGACESGQALVVYHASGAAKGSTGAISVQGGAVDPLAVAGFSASSTWDLSAADTSANTTQAQSDGALSVQSQSGAIASGTDVRVALVSRSDMSTADLVSVLEALDFVECAQPNYHYESYSLGTNDSLSNLQWGLSGSTSSTAGSTEGIGYTSALAKDAGSNTGKEVVVAVMDTGVDYNNPDLEGRMWTDPGTIGLGETNSHGYNGVNNTYDPMPSLASKASHGTHCAGIMAAATNNSKGVSSVTGANSQVKIMALRHEGDDGMIVDSAIMSCYEYLLRARIAGVNVVAVNNSWGSTMSTYAPVLDYVINQVGKAGVLSVFASGNSSADVVNDKQHNTLESPYLISVASSNQTNGLSFFSNYNATSVDVAAPGSNIVATFPLFSGTDHFQPLLSFKCGKTTPADGMLYYSDIAGLVGSGLTVQLVDTTSGSVLADQTALTYAGTTSDMLDSPALELTINNDMLKTQSHDPLKVGVRISWTIDNPFKAASLAGATPGDYAVGIAIDASKLSQCGTINLGAQRVKVAEKLLSGTTNLADDKSYASALTDANWLDSSVLTAIDTTSDTLTAQLLVTEDYRHITDQPDGTWTASVTGYGIGKVTDPSKDSSSGYVPYSYDSGTSMAAPMITGAIGELAALGAGSTALELRGLICGGTEVLATTADQDKIASGGRFTLEAALDSAKVNANTWSITTSGNQVTVHGYALDGARLYVDDASHTTLTATGTSADSITFTAGSSLLDGKSHRFDVVDGTSGRSYKASYVIPSGSADSLVDVGALPVVPNAEGSSLVSAPDQLFLAAGDGSYFYSCSDPTSSPLVWTKLAAPGGPWKVKGSSNLNLDIAYAYGEGKVYAFAVHDVSDGVTTYPRAVLECSVYDIKSGAWSGFAEIVRTIGRYASPIRVTQGGGFIHCEMRYDTYDIENGSITNQKSFATLYTCRAGDSSFAEGETYSEMTYSVCGVGNGLYSLVAVRGKDASGTAAYLVYLAKLDTPAGTFADASPVGDLASSNSAVVISSYLARPLTGVGNGIVVAGDSELGLGDMQLISTSASATKLGSFGFDSASGLVVQSVTMQGGKLYLSCVDHSASAAGTPKVYTLPAKVASLLASTDAAFSVSATAGGSATVADWRGSSTTSIMARSGDKVTWTAKAQEGYLFAGWYDATGTLVSADATYQGVADAAVSLEARFTANPNVTIAYLSSDKIMGSVSPASETIAAVTGTVKGATATPAKGYHFVNWTNARGDVVSTEAALVPAKEGGLNVGATYTAHFAADAVAPTTVTDSTMAAGGPASASLENDSVPDMGDTAQPVPLALTLVAGAVAVGCGLALRRRSDGVRR